MKIIDLTNTNTEELELEIEILSKLNHRNIVKYIGRDVNKLLMEYCEGQTLDKLIWTKSNSNKHSSLIVTESLIFAYRTKLIWRYIKNTDTDFDRT